MPVTIGRGDCRVTGTQAAAIQAYVTQRLPGYIDELRRLCAIECPTAYKAGVDAARAWVKRWVAARGWDLRVWPDETVGDSLVVTLPGESSEGPVVLLAAHLDTVYPVGVAAERPLRQEGDRLIGPGTCDNKSGLLSGLYAMAALQDLNLLGPLGSIVLVCGGDEETDMRSSGALLREVAPQSTIGLVLEAGRENGDFVAARKGAGQFVLTVEGKEAHAGVEPHKGANAILALAQQIAALHALNGIRPGVTVSVGVVEGGVAANVVPGHARAVVDVRVARPEDVEPVEEALRRIATSPFVPGTKGSLGGQWNGPPMATTPEVAAMAALAEECARELGFETRGAATGGLSYANLLASLGLPVLDGLGPVGGLDHSPEEYILVSSIVPRTALLALLMWRHAEEGAGRHVG